MALTIVVACSVLLQLLAAIQAIRLIRVTGVRLAWGLIAAGMFFMTIRRLLALIAGAEGAAILFPDFASEYLALLISAMLLVGVTRIAPLFASIRKGDRALREAGERLSTIIRTSPQAILVTDLGGNIELWNVEAERMFGWSEQKVLHKPSPIIPEDRREELEAAGAAGFLQKPYMPDELLRAVRGVLDARKGI